MTARRRITRHDARCQDDISVSTGNGLPWRTDLAFLRVADWPVAVSPDVDCASSSHMGKADDPPCSFGTGPRTEKVGGSACSLPPCRRPEPSGEFGASSTPTSRAGLVQGRVNLLVAPDEVATVVDVRRRNARTGRRQLLGGRIGAGHLPAEGQAVTRIGVHEPYPNPIPVGRRFSVRPARLTAILDVNPEDHAPGDAPAVGEGVVTRAGEADLVGRRPPRLGPADAVVGI